MNSSLATGLAPGRAPSRYGGVGVWQAQPYSEHIDAYHGGEFSTIVAGRPTVAGDAQVPQTFGPGYCFTIPAGRVLRT